MADATTTPKPFTATRPGYNQWQRSQPKIDASSVQAEHPDEVETEEELLSEPIPEPLNNSPGSEEVEEKSNDKSKNRLIFLPPQEASNDDLPKFYKKRGRHLGSTDARTKALVVYRLTRHKWPYGLSSYMEWYFESKYIRRNGEFYGKTEQWKAEIKRSKIHLVADHSA